MENIAKNYVNVQESKKKDMDLRKLNRSGN